MAGVGNGLWSVEFCGVVGSSGGSPFLDEVAWSMRRQVSGSLVVDIGYCTGRRASVNGSVDSLSASLTVTGSRDDVRCFATDVSTSFGGYILVHRCAGARVGQNDFFAAGFWISSSC